MAKKRPRSMPTRRTTPCWCWKLNPHADDDACGTCGYPKRAHHDNGYRSSQGNGSGTHEP
jgi:hypothetical protein